jgi:NAD(P)-dependent dehydrogenase (short-subunit alcohol dehydrogenase family)
MKTLFVACCVAVLASLGSAHAATVLITGSDRGLGLEFVKQYAARGDTVIATCRHPEKATDLQAIAAAKKNVIVETLDVSDDANIRSLAAKYRGKPIDVLINNAGVLGAHEDQTLGTFSRKAFQEVMDINAFAPLAVAEAFRERVIASKEKKIVAITSGAGVITAAGSMPKGPYYYRMSKAALDMGVAALGADLRSQGVAVAAVSPGATATDMLTTFTADYGVKFPSRTPAQSVAGMIAVIAKLDPSTAGKGIFNVDGTVSSW